MIARRKDANQGEVVRALRKIGAVVHVLHTPADLLVGFRKAWHLIEVKDGAKPTSARQLTVAEAIVAAECQWEGLPYHVVTSPTEALQAIGASPKCEPVLSLPEAQLRPAGNVGGFFLRGSREPD